MRKGQIKFFIKFKLLRNNPENFSASFSACAVMLAANYFIYNRIRNIFDMIRQFICGQSNLIIAFLRIAPEKSFFFGLSFDSGKYSAAQVSLYGNGENSGGKNSPYLYMRPALSIYGISSICFFIFGTSFS